MHTTKTDNLTVHHDGGFDGPMYLIKSTGAGIITTLNSMVQAVEESSEETISLTGPDADNYDRHDVTEFVDGKTLLRSGDWETRTIQVYRKDVLRILFYCLCRNISYQVDELDYQDENASKILLPMNSILQTLNDITGEESEIAKALSALQAR